MSGERRGVEASENLAVEAREPRNERGDHDLGGSPRPIVGLDREAEPGLGQCRAEHALGARLGEGARAKNGHGLRVETAFSGDGQGVRGYA